MTNAVASVVIAAAQSVAKVFVIGGIGYAAVKYPIKAPLLPSNAVSTVARFNFNVLTIPLIFSTIGSSVTIDSIGDYWFVLIGAIGVISISFITSTMLSKIIIPNISNPADYHALRIAATFPNIVALPILIFPSLCEYEVVFEGFASVGDNSDDGTSLTESNSTADQQYRQCVATSNTMIFCYFFGWSLLFWSFGHPTLISAAKEKSLHEEIGQGKKVDDDNDNNNKINNKPTDNIHNKYDNTVGSTTTMTTIHETEQEPNEDNSQQPLEELEENDHQSTAELTVANTDHATCSSDDDETTTTTTNNNNNNNNEQQQQNYNDNNNNNPRPQQKGHRVYTNILSNIVQAIKHTFSSPPFIAMLLAFAVGCIAPIRNLLFSQGGQLRFLGAALETLGTASSPMGTMVVAASLASSSSSSSSSSSQQHEQEVSQEQEEAEDKAEEDVNNADVDPENDGSDEENQEQYDHSPIPPQQQQQSKSAWMEERQQESPIMSDPNFGPLQLRRRSSLAKIGRAIKRSSVKVMKKASRTPIEQRRLLLWFTLSKLILSPALVIASIIGLDCSGILSKFGVPDLAKLILIVNSSVPGALIVVVLLKSNPALHETASVVARVYLPTYVLSIVTIAAWTAVGLIVSLPDEDGNSFCERSSE